MRFSIFDIRFTSSRLAGGAIEEVSSLEDAYPDAGFLWLDTEDSEGEVFWLPAAE